jgi:hypothetical protein
MAEAKIIGKKERSKHLQTMLENIATELAPIYESKYDGKLAVKKAEYDERSTYISLESEKVRHFLWRPHITKSEELVFAVSEQFSDEPNKENKLGILSKSKFYNDEATRNVIQKYIAQFVTDCAPIITHPENFRYVMDK